MQSIKKLRLPVVILFLMIVVEFLTFCFFSNNYRSLYWNSDISDIIEKGENVDMIFVGTSRVYQGISPEIIENELGLKNVCDAASPEQDVKGRYYLLKDMLESFTPKYVVLEAGMNSLKIETKNEFNRNVTMDRIRSVKNKLEYFWDDFTIGEAILFLPTFRFIKGNSLSDLIFDLTSRMDYFARNGEPEEIGSVEGDSEYYVKNGYYYDIDENGGEWNFHLEVNMDEVAPYIGEYYQKMIDLCIEREIKVLMISMPLPRRQLFDADGYMTAVDYYNDIADRNGIFYANMNFHKELGDELVETDFADDLHLNGRGSEITSMAYAEVVRNYEAGEDMSQYFYEDLDDLSKDIDGIISVNATLDYDNRDSNYILEFESAEPDRFTPEYRYQLINRKTGETELESDYSEDKELIIYKDKDEMENYTLKVFARTVGSDVDYEVFRDINL
ncbi:hypothetical protein QYZ88_010100 [Lachnospiraceae bacterium C1.1]|nr:SGNH/GDSL hydrolase family protein [Lachnospiraceae bacterium C1.1]